MNAIINGLQLEIMLGLMAFTKSQHQLLVTLHLSLAKIAGAIRLKALAVQQGVIAVQPFDCHLFGIIAAIGVKMQRQPGGAMIAAKGYRYLGRRGKLACCIAYIRRPKAPIIGSGLVRKGLEAAVQPPIGRLAGGNFRRGNFPAEIRFFAKGCLALRLTLLSSLAVTSNKPKARLTSAVIAHPLLGGCGLGS